MEVLKLGDVAKVVTGITAPKVFDSNGNVPFYRAGSLEKLVEDKYSENEKLNSDDYNNKIVPAGTIIFAKSGMSIFKNRVYKTKKDSVIVSHLMGIIPGEKINGDYLKFYFKKNKPSTLSNNPAYPSLKASDVQKIIIKVPDIDVQKEIAEDLNNIEKMIKIKKEIIDDLNELINSKFNELFPKGKYDSKTLNSISTEAGEYGSGASSKEFDPSLPRYVRITDINDDGSLNEQSKVSPNGENDIERFLLKENDILFARTGATVGKTYKYNVEDGICIFAGYCIRFRLNPEIVNADYVFSYTKTKEYKKWVELKQRVVAQPNINAKEYGNDLLIPIPPLSEQEKFAEISKEIILQRKIIEEELKDLNLLMYVKLNEYYE